MVRTDTCWIVDDNELMRFLARRVFQRHAKHIREIKEFADGWQAIEAFGKACEPKPGLILLDINMQPTSGWEVLDFISKFKKVKEITVAVLSSSVEGRYRNRAYSYPCVKQYLAKPLTTFSLELLGIRS